MSERKRQGSLFDALRQRVKAHKRSKPGKRRKSVRVRDYLRAWPPKRRRRS